jgi:polysaccharide biosynthesis/export protein
MTGWRARSRCLRTLRDIGALAACVFAFALMAPADPASAAGSIPPATAGQPANPMLDYRIGPLDTLSITVFQVKDLTVDKMQVDASGQILLPLIGSVMAKGKTTTELSAEIARRLGEHYLQSPQVSVVVNEAVSQKISVEGAVNEAGVFELKGRTSLLEAVARAKGASRNANLHKVTIVRSVDGTPHAASFDLAAIGAGKARNPEVLANDVVIVDGSRIKSMWQGVVQVLPALIFLTYI